MSNTNTKTIVLVFAMLCITIMASVAMLAGINGVTTTASIGAVVSIAGYLYTRKQESKPVQPTEENE